VADPIREAMKRVMAESKPNSGSRPPELTVTEDSHVNCGTCEHFNGAGLCRLYSYKVKPDMVCSSWAPKPK
jgi:hypothetical protein